MAILWQWLKKHIGFLLDDLAVVVVAMCATAWLNVIPTFWRPEILDANLLFGITTRTLITFLIAIICALHAQKFIKNFTDTILLAALLPLMVWLVKSLYYWGGNTPNLSVSYPIFGIMLVWTSALWAESVLLEIRNHTLSCLDVIEDFLFSVALSLLFYGVLTILRQPTFGFNALAMSPALCFVQLQLSKHYHHSSKAP